MKKSLQNEGNRNRLVTTNGYQVTTNGYLGGFVKRQLGQVDLETGEIMRGVVVWMRVKYSPFGRWFMANQEALFSLAKDKVLFCAIGILTPNGQNCTLREFKTDFLDFWVKLNK